MSDAMLWPYGKCVECANKRDCVDSHAQIIACMSNGYPNYKPQTNADRIRQMSDEELADFMSNCEPCCESGWLDWLKQEVKDGE